MSINKELGCEADKFGITGLTLIKPQDVYNLFVSAYNYSYYWCGFSEESWDAIYAASEDIQCIEDKVVMAIQRGVKVEVRDVESDEILGYLTPESWAKAEKLLMEKHQYHLGLILKEEDDAITGDVFLQLAVMGDIVYG